MTSDGFLTGTAEKLPRSLLPKLSRSLCHISFDTAKPGHKDIGYKDILASNDIRPSPEKILL